VSRKKAKIQHPLGRLILLIEDYLKNSMRKPQITQTDPKSGESAAEQGSSISDCKRRTRMGGFWICNDRRNKRRKGSTIHTNWGGRPYQAYIDLAIFGEI
jgi:hypothetical protein